MFGTGEAGLNPWVEMDINQVVQYGTLAAVAVALYQAFIQRAKDRGEVSSQRATDRDEQTKWRTEADLKLESIDVNWKPQVNTRLDSLDKRMLNLDKQLVEHNKTVISELRSVNKGINQLDKTVALAVQARQNLEERVEKLEGTRER